jgi:hypothetical protein
MNQEIINKNAKDLFALTKEFGPERVKIPQNFNEAMDFIRKFSFKLDSAFAFDDPQVVDKARRLAKMHSTVFVIVNANTQKTELYIP